MIDELRSRRSHTTLFMRGEGTVEAKKQRRLERRSVESITDSADAYDSDTSAILRYELLLYSLNRVVRLHIAIAIYIDSPTRMHSVFSNVTV